MVPSTVKVGGLTYKIQMKDLNRDVARTAGNCKDACGSIVINKNNDFQIVVNTIIHELVHAIDFVYCGCSMSENTVEILSNSIYQVIVDNDDFLNGNIPDYLNICGFKYKIEFPDDFQDLFCEDDNEFVLAYCDIENIKIYLSEKIVGLDLSKDIIVSNLVYAVMNAIIDRYNIKKEDFNSEIYLSQFCFGLQQVFSEINIKKIYNEMKVDEQT